MRSTNTGFTAIVGPTGDTLASLPVFSDGILRSKVIPLTDLSPYTAYVGDYPWLILSLGFLGFAILGWRR